MNKKTNGAGGGMDVLEIILSTMKTEKVAPYCLHEGTRNILDGNYETAERYLRKAVELKPKYGEAHYNLGECLRLQGNFEGAIKHFTEAAELEPYLKEKLKKRINPEKEVSVDGPIIEQGDLRNISRDHY